MTPEGWRRCPVEELLSSVGTGVSVNGQSRPRETGEIGVLRISSVTYGAFRPEENKAVLANELHRVREPPRKGCVLVSRANTQDLVGASVFVPRDFSDLVLPDKLWQLYPDPAATDGRWLQLALSTERMRARISEVATGTSGSMKNISREKFLALDILSPPLPEQRKIAAILSSVDAAIEGTQAVIDQLQVVKKAMMADLLTRGIPGRHKTFKQTDIGKIPAEWEVVRLGEQLREPIRNGYSPVCPTSPTGKWILHVGAVTFDGYSPEGIKPAPLNDPRVDSATLEPGDLIVSRSNTRERVGLAGIYSGSPSPCSYPDLLMRVRVAASVRARYLEAVLLSEIGRGYLSSSARGTSASMVKINRETLESFRFPLPSLPEQDAIVSALAAVKDVSLAERRNHEALVGLKSALMSVLLTGEVRVRVGDEVAA